MEHNSCDTLIACGHLFPWAGGPVKTIGEFSKALSADVYSFVEASLLKKEDLALKEAIPIVSVPIPILEKLYVPRLSKEYKRLNQHVRDVGLISCHSFYRYQILWALRAKLKYGAPYWHVPHGSLDPYVTESGKAGKDFFMSLVGRRFMDQAACTIFATKREWEKAESVYGKIRGEVVHWPVELVDLSEREVKRNAVRERLGIPEDAKVLLYFGRVHEMKRPLETIEAVAQVKSDDLHLVMVGPGEGISSDELHRKASAIGLNNFHYAGGVFSHEKYDYLFAADAYVSFSIRENFNHTAAESMSAELPVILSKGNDLGPLVEQNNLGWYLKEDTIEELKSTIEIAIGTGAAEFLRMGNDARAFVGNAFSYANFKSRLLELSKCYGRS